MTTQKGSGNSFVKPEVFGIKSVATIEKEKGDKWLIQLLSSLGDFTGIEEIEKILDKIDVEQDEYELSVVVEGGHGECSKGNGSWGWSGDDKIIIAECQDQYSTKILKKLFEFGCKLTEDLNK